MPLTFILAIKHASRAVSALPAARALPPLLCHTRPHLSRFSHTRGLATAPRYKRIRMFITDDDARAYQLLPTYLENPDLAHSVKEFSMIAKDGCNWTDWVRQWKRGGPRDPPFSVTDSQHAAIKSHVRQLGMPAEPTQVMLDSLDWWRSCGTLDLHYGDTPEALYSSPRIQTDKKRYGEFSETLIILMLSLCSNIEIVYFLYGPGHRLIGDYLLASNYGRIPRPCLQQLKHVRWAGQPGVTGFFDTVELLDILRCVHRLPKITSLAMEGISDYNTEPQLFPPKTSKNLKEIYLTHVHFCPDTLHTILRIPVGLQKLSLSFGGLDHHDDEPNLDATVLGAVLREHKDTLRELDLDLGTTGLIISGRDRRLYLSHRYSNDWINGPQLRDYYAMDVADSLGPLRLEELLEYDRESYSVGSLQEMTALTRLFISIEALMGEVDSFGRIEYRPRMRLVDMLPPNLEYLRLYDYVKGRNAELDADVEELMREKAALLPRLREVVGVDKTDPGMYGELGPPDEDGRDYALWPGRKEPELDWAEVEV